MNGMSGFRAFYCKGDSKESNGDISSVVFKNGLSCMCKLRDNQGATRLRKCDINKVKKSTANVPTGSSII